MRSLAVSVTLTGADPTWLSGYHAALGAMAIAIGGSPDLVMAALPTQHAARSTAS